MSGWRARQWTIVLQTSAMNVPMKSEVPTVTQPAQGVIPTRPATAPTATPMAEGLRPKTASQRNHVSIAAAEAVFVYSFVVSLILYWVTDCLVHLRVSTAHEREGLDLSQHGEHYAIVYDDDEEHELREYHQAKG